MDLPHFKNLPEVILHEHPDGGVRPATVIGLARELKYEGLPTSDPAGLAGRFHRGAWR